MPANGSSKVNLIAALGTGATAAVVLWMFVSFSREQGMRQDAMIRDNREQLERLVRLQSDAMGASALSMEKLAIAVERVNIAVEGISKSGFGQILGAINKATEVQKQVVEAVKPEAKQ
jgi:hypothetical protein